MVNERPTEHLIQTGNYFKDVVDNIVEILVREQEEDLDQELTYIKRVHDVYDNDIIHIPEVPCIAVSWQGYQRIVKTIGQKYPVREDVINDVIVYYYHEEIKDDIRKDEIRNALWEIDRILRRNSDLNGLSTQGATVEGGQLMNRIRAEHPYSGGLIRLRVPVSIRTRRGVTP